MNELLTIENLHKDFSKLSVLSGISMQIRRGERHAILGPNGAGKTTLFNIITGMYRPSKGKIHFQSRDITRMPVHKIARIGLCRSFQISNIFPGMTVYQNVRNAVISKLNRRFCCTALVHRDKEVEKESQRVLELLRLDDVKDLTSSELSYGRQRHLELAMTMALDPIFIMLDEPTAGLNSEETRNAIKTIKRIAEGKTLAMVEHDMDVVFSIADRITVLNNGTVLASGTPDEIRQNEWVKKAYLGRK